MLGASSVYAGGKISIDDTKWISVGLGLRTEFDAVENAAPNGKDWSKNFSINSMRLYFNGQIAKYIKFTVNTECFSCTGSGQKFSLLDGIARFEFSPMFNIWAGRMLTPSDRLEMSGPYYDSTFSFNKIALYAAWPQDQATNDYGAGNAGVYGRDHGVDIWGHLGDRGQLVYAAGVFQGVQSASGFGPNQDGNLLYAGSLRYNFLSVEPAPAYYTGSTYYGGAGDIFTVGFATQYQADAVGTATSRSDFFGYSFDVLYEKILANSGVVTLQGEYKNFDAKLSAAAKAAGAADATAGTSFSSKATCFCSLVDGQAWTATALYLFPQKVGWGQFQPYLRYSAIDPTNKSMVTASSEEYEGGLNYVIDGPNAKVSLYYQSGDITTGGGKNVDSIHLGVQLQI